MTCKVRGLQRHLTAGTEALSDPERLNGSFLLHLPSRDTQSRLRHGTTPPEFRT